jgi:hypothetical protein
MPDNVLGCWREDLRNLYTLSGTMFLMSLYGCVCWDLMRTKEVFLSACVVITLEDV